MSKKQAGIQYENAYNSSVNLKMKTPKSMIMNSRSFMNYYERLKNIALNMFEWKNLPRTVDVRWLELCLFEFGYCLFFFDDELGFLTLNCSIGGRLNVYRTPTLYRPITPSGIVFPEYTIDDSVLIWNNFTRTNTEWIIIQFAERLARLERTIDINVNAQKTPYVYVTDDNTRLSIENMAKKVEDFEPAIIANKSIDIENGVKLLDMKAPFVADKLEMQKRRIWNEAMTFLGVKNNGAEKRERLVAEEADGSDDVEAMRFVMLNARQQACNQINEMFGLDISVDFRKPYKEVLNERKEEAEILELDSDYDENESEV